MDCIALRNTHTSGRERACATAKAAIEFASLPREFATVGKLGFVRKPLSQGHLCSENKTYMLAPFFEKSILPFFVAGRSADRNDRHCIDFIEGADHWSTGDKEW